MQVSESYDYVFLGAGCASLSLLMRMIKTGHSDHKKILLIDRDAKSSNDRTWCYWEKDKGFFDEAVFKKWNIISFLSDTYQADMNIAPYQYKMIRGIDFYQHCFREISTHSNIHFVAGSVAEWSYVNGLLEIEVDTKQYRFENTILFNSIYRPNNSEAKPIKLLQHFKGWVVEAAKDVFDPQRATMMDFRVHQQHGTSFIYVLPFDSRTALVEYTLFTKKILVADQYARELHDYIQTFLGITDYTIKEEEFGVIPMSNEKLPFERNGWNIGTAGGQTKGSSGYTFQFIQKQTQQIMDCLVAGTPLRSLVFSPARFRFYDNTLLEILYHNKLPGKKIFTTLFQKNKPQQVLRFLDNESTIKDELKIISSLPAWPFLKAAIKQL